MKKEFYKTNTSIGAILVIIGFLLPWISFGIFNLSGYDIPKLIEMSRGVSNIFQQQDKEFSYTQLYYFLYVLPLLGGYLLYNEYNQTSKFVTLSKSIIFVVTITFICVAAWKFESFWNLLKISGYGLWLTLAGSTFLFRQVVNENKLIQKCIAGNSEDLNETYNKIVQEKNNYSRDFKVKVLAFNDTFSSYIKKHKKPIFIVLIILVTGVTSSLILHKNSYEKMMSSFDQKNWKEVKYYYGQANSEIADNDLKLDYDERKKLELAYEISTNLLLFDSFKEKFKNRDKGNLLAFIDFEKEWLSLPDLEIIPSEAEVLGFNVEEIYKPYILLNDSYNIAYCEIMLQNLKLKITQTKEIIKKKQQPDINLLSSALDTTVSQIKYFLNRVSDTKGYSTKSKIKKVNYELNVCEKTISALIKKDATDNFILSSFNFVGKQGDFDNGYSENKELFESKTFVGYESTLQGRSFVICINNEQVLLSFKDENYIKNNKENEDTNEGDLYYNDKYTVTVEFIERLDDSPSEDQGEAIYKLVVNDLLSGKKIIKKVYCNGTFF
jgi:hypothetical protein